MASDDIPSHRAKRKKLKTKDTLVGQKFNLLTVVSLSHVKRGRFWNCTCECGGEKKVSTGLLTSGRAISCGCRSQVGHNSSCKTHGLSRTRLWNVWAGMNERCRNPKHEAFHNYGGRGITICPEWLESATFFKWAVDNGYTDDLEIDRIDNDAGYWPNNCRFISRKEQSRNRRTNVIFEHDGQRKTMAEWAEISGIPYPTVQGRIRRGWTIGRSISEPINIRHRRRARS